MENNKSKTKLIFEKVVLISGILNFPIGLMMMIRGFLSTNAEVVLSSMIVGAFIIFAGAAVIWAIKDLQARASIIVWNALVRAIAVFIVAYATILGAIPIEMMIISSMDLIVAIIYILGSVKYTGLSFTKLLIGKVK